MGVYTCILDFFKKGATKVRRFKRKSSLVVISTEQSMRDEKSHEKEPQSGSVVKVQKHNLALEKKENFREE